MAKLFGTSSTSDFEPTGEINVTPFIDVMLVLLLVFMIAAPISTVDVPVDLPSSSATASVPPDKPITVSIRSDLSVYVGSNRIAPARLGDTLARMGAKPSTTIFLRIDRTVDYGDTIATLDALRRAGYAKVALVGLEAGG